MLDDDQARAYAEADFREPHEHFVDLFAERFPGPVDGFVLDLGCGPGDVSLRFAARYPRCMVHGIDGAPAMLAAGEDLCRQHPAGPRVTLLPGRLPAARGPGAPYSTIISNSLLHHLHVPGVMWATILRDGAQGARVFVMDLCRPDSAEQADALVARHAADAPEVLRRDFRNSLHAAFKARGSAWAIACGRAGWISGRTRSVTGHLVVWGQL
jgi:trans-aconitate methyltransferase